VLFSKWARQLSFRVSLWQSTIVFASNGASLSPMVAALPLIYFLAGFALAAGMNGLAAIPWRRLSGAHWSERARLLFPVRRSAAANLIFIPGICAAASAAAFPDAPISLLWWAVAAFPGAIFGTFPLNREILPHLTFRDWLHEVSAAWLFRILRVAVFIGAAFAMPEDWSWRQAVIVLGVLALQSALIWGGSIWIAARLRLISPPPERLTGIVGQVAQKLSADRPRLWLLHGTTSNALAMPLTRTLLVSERLLATCSDAEVAAICAHEFAHLAESRGVLVVRFFGALAMYPYLFFRPALAHFEGFGILGMTLASLAIATILGKVSRRMETRADTFASAQEGESAQVYARALARLYEVNQMPAVMPGKRQIHPHLYDRLLAAGVTPDFPRPKAPHIGNWSSMMLGLLLAGLVAFAAIKRSTNF